MKPFKIFQYKTPYYGVIDRFIVNGSLPPSHSDKTPIMDPQSVIDKIILKTSIIGKAERLFNAKETLQTTARNKMMSLSSDNKERILIPFIVVKCLDTDLWRTKIIKVYPHDDEKFTKLASLI